MGRLGTAAETDDEQKCGEGKEMEEEKCKGDISGAVLILMFWAGHS
jgi:hypothetical protein